MARYTKPNRLPFWATDDLQRISGQPNKLYPGREREAMGWEYNQAPAGNIMNYFQDNYWRWLGYLNGWKGRRTAPSNSTEENFTVNGVQPGDIVWYATNQVGSNDERILSIDVTANDTVTVKYSGQLGANHIYSYYIQAGD